MTQIVWTKRWAGWSAVVFREVHAKAKMEAWRERKRLSGTRARKALNQKKRIADVLADVRREISGEK